MNKEDILNAVKQIREKSKKRNFSQTFDLTINFKDINIKDQEKRVDKFIVIPYGRGKKIKICAFVDQELAKPASEIFDRVILKEDFLRYTNKKKEQRLLVNSYDYFVAQSTLMSQIASTFGKVFGSRGKMPNPKAGCVVVNTAQLKPLHEKLQKTVRLAMKNEAVIKVPVGIETMKDEEIIENILTVYDNLMTSLPQGKQNIKNMFLKLTMGQPIKIGEKEEKKKK